MNNATTIHPFEAAGLGLAPFRYIGMESQRMRGDGRVIGSIGGVEITTKPGGTCAYCGTYIVQMFNVKSADGKVFHVGCDCVTKVGDKELIAAVQSDAKKHKKEAKAARDADKIAWAKSKLIFVAGTLAAEPHPSEAMTSRGATLLDYVKWMLENAGMAGKLKAAAIIKKARE